MELITQPRTLILPPDMIKAPGIILPEPLVVVDTLADPANLTREELEIIRVLNPEAAVLLAENEPLVC